MFKFSKEKYFYYIALMQMASVFLLIASNNAPSIVLSYRVWSTIWILSLIAFYPKIFSNRIITTILIYGLFLFIAKQTLWWRMDTWNSSMLNAEFYQIAISISITIYFLQIKDYMSLAKITKWSIIFILITAIMTIISSTIDPLYARKIIGVGGLVINEYEKKEILSVRRYGGGGYGTAAAFMCLFPLIIYFYKNIQKSLISKRLIIIFVAIILFALLSLQLFANIIIAISFSIFALLGLKRIKKHILVIFLIFSLLVFTPYEVYSDALFSLSNVFDKDSEINFKLKDLAEFINKASDIDYSRTATGGRLERYPQLLNIFIKNPIFGCYFLTDNPLSLVREIEGQHLHWMNKLTTTGIVGLLLFLSIPYKFIKNNLYYFSSEYKFYYILASLAILTYGLLKTIVGAETWYTLFIILPGLYYIPLLKIKH